MSRPGIALAVTGLILTVIGACGAVWSLWRMRGTAAGAAVSAACGGICITGAALAILGTGAIVGCIALPFWDQQVYDYYGTQADEMADEGYVPEPVGQYWADDEGECSICLETLTDCTCLDNLRPGETGGKEAEDD